MMSNSTHGNGFVPNISRREAPAKPKALRRQKGFDLVQIAIVVGVIGVLMAAAFIGVPKVMASVRATSEAQDLQAFVLAHQQVPAADAITEETALSMYPAGQLVAAVPGKTDEDAGTSARAVNRFGGDVTFKVVGQVTTLTSLAVPTQACEKLVPIAAGVFDGVQIGGTSLKIPNGTLASSTSIKAACSATPVVNVVYTLNR